ncbi:YbfB/YjiJ family MFS transporter [Pseudodonghicola flavimaris]|uniref:YbfB/YjiJ family MFS transporter n=1 Tax=Pseudodonghicola flavimaris TaxID=3050036 RepID=A0ABT7EYG5_9RHOB|nr:YbfB/YjiJ family MFS transporter [Pseudodonghicola flavimaris]MDK3017382.1 YbfB/YjiJ family MFS transporter [Pseudodonghicola flavimaris]
MPGSDLPAAGAPHRRGGAAERHPWLVVLGLALGLCITNGFARFAYSMLLPAMRADLGWSYAQAGWLNTANALGYLVGAVLTMILIGRISASRLFSFGLVTTTAALLLTGVDAALWWQTLWRVLAGVFGALSFSTGGALAARLFPDNPRQNALAIAILFGFGGGFGIVLAGSALPLMLAHYGPSSWPMGWIWVGIACVVFAPLALWSGESLRPPKTAAAAPPTRLPLLRMLPELLGYGAFGMGYIVYMTFLSAWMTEQGAGAGLIAAVWALLGLCLCLSPFVWRPVFARSATGLPLALILGCIALGSGLAVLFPAGPGLAVSAAIFGLSVFMAPGAVTNFARQNLPPEAWGPSISLFTVVFAVSQTVGPVAAGWLGDATGDIGNGLLSAAGILATGGLAALLQRRIGGD